MNVDWVRFRSTLLKRIATLGALFTAFSPLSMRANDAAASTALGGIQLKREERIVLQKELLQISLGRIHVQYEFFNETSDDITTEVAFPIPAYDNNYTDPLWPRSFEDFTVRVDGRRRNYEVDIKAEQNGHDYTELLRRSGVDISSFGHFDRRRFVARDIARLSKQQQAELIGAGLVNKADLCPNWTVTKTYHWTKTFPARRVLRVQHDYRTVNGFTQLDRSDLDAGERSKTVAMIAERRKSNSEEYDWLEPAESVENSCLSPALGKEIAAEAQARFKLASARDDLHSIDMQWVDYILTTANTWKTPIKDFELVVERPKRKGYSVYVSFCWDGPIERRDADHFVARAVDFVPRRELHIGFIEP